MSTFAHSQIKPSQAPVLNHAIRPSGVVDTVINPRRQPNGQGERINSVASDSQAPNLDALIWFVRLMRE